LLRRRGLQPTPAVQIARGQAGEFALSAKINGVKAPMVIDTGATSVVLTWETAKAIGLPMLDRMYKEYPKGQAPEPLERLAGKIRDADGLRTVAKSSKRKCRRSAGERAHRTALIRAASVAALATPDGSTRRVADGIAFPNGMLVTPDSTLIVAETYANRLTAFDIAADGGLSNRRVWADLHDGFPDGICLDAENAVWYGDVPNKRCVRVREGGAVLQTIELDRGCFACALGGPEKRTLFMMAQEWNGPDGMFEEPRTGQVLMTQAPAPAAGWP